MDPQNQNPNYQMPPRNPDTRGVTVTPVMPPRGGGVGAWFSAVLAILLVISMGFNLFLLGGSIGAGGIHLPSAGSGKYEEALVEGDATSDSKIVVIDVMGVISHEAVAGPFGLAGESLVDSVVGRLREAALDNSVKAVVLNIDSPGGGVDASETIYNEVKKLRAEKEVVVQMNTLAASGGYYISAPASKIFAHPTTVTGSIGVIMQLPIINRALEHLKIDYVTIKSGSMKDWGSPFNEFTKEEETYFQKLLDGYHDRFKNLVVDGRKSCARFDPAKINEIAQGQIFSPKEAEEIGLIDNVGFLEDAIEEARKLSGTSNAKVIRYQGKSGLASLFSMEAPKAPIVINSGVNINMGNLAEGVPTFQFLWQVGK